LFVASMHVAPNILFVLLARPQTPSLFPYTTLFRSPAHPHLQPGSVSGRMMPFKELVLASHNAGKLKELQAMLGAHVRVRSIGEFSSIEAAETGLSFVANALLK